MTDGVHNFRVTNTGPEGRMPSSRDDRDEDSAPVHPLDTGESMELHGRLMGFYRRELDRQYENRAQMAQDEDYYDHIQFSEDEINALDDRGQLPIVYNVSHNTINWLRGAEIRARKDGKVLPRRKEDAKAAERKTALMKYLSDVNRTVFSISKAYKDALVAGVGWIETGVQDDDDGEPIYERYESWRNMLWDSSSSDDAIKDCRYLFRSRWTDEDVAMALAPDRYGLIHQSATTTGIVGLDRENADDPMDQQEYELDMGGWAGTEAARPRVRLIEAWFRRPARQFREGMFEGQFYDHNNMEHRQAIASGQSVLSDRVQMRMYCAIMTTTGLLYLGESPYRHNDFPFTPIWGIRRGRDNLPYGVMRGLRGIQDSINKRATKALAILSYNKTIMDEEAVEDIEKYRDEAARPDAVIVKRPGKMLEMNADRGLEQAHLEFMSRDIQMIQQVGGVTDELKAQNSGNLSGKAIGMLQDQGMMSTSIYTDNLFLARQIHGEKKLSLVEQYITEEKAFRITNSRGSPEFVTVNDGLPENDIHNTKADFILSETEFRATMRLAQAEMLTEMLSRMPPEVALVMLDLVVELYELPNRDELVRRIRQMNGQRDPDATEPTPEEIAATQAAQQQQQMAQAMMEAELRDKTATAAGKEIDVAKKQGDMAKSSVETQDKALDAAAKVATAPALAPVADTILREAGFVPAQPAAPQPIQQPQPVPQPQ